MSEKTIHAQDEKSLQDQLKDTLLASPLLVGILDEPKYGTRGRIGDEILEGVDLEAGMKITPTSNTMLHVYPEVPLTTFDDYKRFYLQVFSVVLPLKSDITLISPADIPKVEYLEEDAPTPIIDLGRIDVLYHFMPAIASLTTLVIHPSKDIATRFRDSATEPDVLEVFDSFTIYGHELGEFTFPPQPETPSEIPPIRRPIHKQLLGNLAERLRRIAES